MDELLKRYQGCLQPLSALESIGGGGGYSGARLWRYRAAQGQLVLRQWPAHGPGRDHLEQVHHWMFLTADLGFVPVPFRDRAGVSLQDWQGSLWEVTPWLAGVADLSYPPNSEHLRLAFTSLAAFHERLVTEQVFATSPGLRMRRDTLAALVRGEFDMLESATERALPNNLAKADVYSWLALARRIGPMLVAPLEQAAARIVPVQPCLRDARPEHFLFEGDRLSGLVDYGAMGVDSVAADLARLLGEWTGGDSAARREALDSYARVRPLGPTEASLIRVFESATALLIGERWLRWKCIEGRAFDDPNAFAKGLARSLSKLRRLEQQVAERSGLAEFFG
jgi:aminoglycoside phosphotransferase (APT) family kinase protein